MKFEVTKVYQYTETVYVEADSAQEARDLASEIEGQINNDDTYYDCIVMETYE
jgi:DNA-dependent RNA polymerase auxiliary subunit epsilon